jgi:hypothetical protein
VVSPQISATYRGANEYRPNYVPGNSFVNCHGGHSCLSHLASNGTVNYVNLAAFTIPSIYQASATTASNANIASPFGNGPRNPSRTPNFFQTDLDLNKRFSTPIERLNIEFRAEAYNIFNHTNLYLPSTISGSAANFTQASPTGGGSVSGTFEPRILQFGLKVIY